MSKLNAFNRFTATLLLSAAPAAILVSPNPAAAQSTNAGTVGSTSANGAGATAFSGATTNTAGADTTTITLGNSRTILNWDGLSLSAGDTLNFVFGGSTDIVLNRVTGGNFTSIDGSINGSVGAVGGASGGNIWILNPNGILVGSTGSINAGGILLSNLGMTDADFFDGNASYNLTGVGSTFVGVTGGANLTATNGAVTLVSPAISFGGNANASGSIALVGASDAQIVFDSDLDAYVGITVNQGSSENIAIDVTQDASFNAAAVASGGKTYLVAAGNGTGLGSILLGGVSANRVEFVEGDVVIYAAGEVPGGAAKSIVSGGVLQGLGSATGAGDVTIGAANVSAGNLNVIAVDEVIINDAVSVSGNARFEAASNLTVNTAVTAGGDYTIRADDFFGGAAFTPNEGGDINIEDTAGGLTIGNLAATDDLRITAENGNLTIAGGAVSAANGSVYLTATGANAGAGFDVSLQSNVTDTGADDSVVLNASGAITQSASGVITAGTLSGSAGGYAALGNATNALGALGNFSAQGLYVKDSGSLAINGALIDSGTGNLDVEISGAGTLSITNSTLQSSGAGSTRIRAATTGGTVLNGTTIDGGTAVNFSGSVTTTGTSSSIGSAGDVNFDTYLHSFGADLAVTAGDDINIYGTLNGPAGLDLDAADDVWFQGYAGATALGSLEVSADGIIYLVTGATTTGSQTFDGVVYIADVVLASTGLGNISFNDSVEGWAGSRNLTVNTAGATTFNGDVGGTTALTSLTTNAGGTTTISANSIRTTGAQTYGDSVIIPAGLHTLNASSISFGNTVNGGANSTLFTTTTGATSFANSIFMQGSLGIDAGTVSFVGLNNRVGTLAANISAGGFSFGTDSSLTIGTVNGLSGITTAAGQNISIETPSSISARTLTLLAPITASGGGDISILYWGGSVQGSGLISGDSLLIALNEGVGTSANPVRTAVNSMSVWGGNQGVFLSEADAVSLVDTNIPACNGTCTSTINNGGASYDLTAGGTITVEGFTWTGSGGISLASSGGNIVLSMPSYSRIETWGDLSLTAAGYIQNVNAAPLYGRDIYLTAQDFVGSILSAGVLQETRDLSITDTAGGLTAVGLSAANDLSIATTNGGNLVVQGANAGGDISLNSASNLALTGAIDATGDTLTLNASDNITQTAAVTAATLTGSAGGQATLTNVSNQVSNLGAFSSNGLSLNDVGGLVVSGAIDGGANAVTLMSSGDLTVNGAITADQHVQLNATGAGSDVSINSAVSAGVGDFGILTLRAEGAGGTITQSAGGILTADALSVSSAGSATLTAAANDVASLVATANGFAFADAGGLTIGATNGGAGGVDISSSGDIRVDGAVSSTNGPISLAATGAGSDLGVYAAINAGTGAIHLDAGATIGQSAAGTITAGSLTGSAGGTLLLGATNQLAAIGDLSGTSIVVGDSGGLAITGAVDSGSGDITIRTSGGDLTVAPTGGISGANVVLSTDQDFHNASGSDAITASARWLVYSATPDGNTFGGLDSGTTAIWDAALATDAPSTITGTHYVFAYQPTLTFTSLDASKIYGTAITTSPYDVSGYHAGVANAFLGDTSATAFSGAPTLSSAGYAAGADVAGGPYAVTIAAGTTTSSSGYAIAYSSTGQLTVDPKAITGTVIADDKTYDATTGATGTITLDGVIIGDEVTASALLAFADANAGSNKTVNISGGTLSGADSGNYTLSLPASVLADIFQKALTGVVVADDKTYDGTTDATGTITLDGVISGDEVTASAILAFANANAGSNKTVTISGGSLSGADAGNYTLSLPGSVLADIFQKAITGTVVADDKTYDGATAASGTITLYGVIAGDEVTASAILAFADANAGSNKTVNISGGSLSGADSGNYTLSLPASVLADIFQKALTGTVVADDKTYDGTTAATGTITLDGVIAGDEVTASAILAFADANAGSNKTVNISGGSLSGGDSGNYTLSLPASVLADIFQKAITGTVVADDKTYDGTTSATGSITLAGIVDGDDVSASALLAFADKNAGSSKTVLITGASLSGTDASNYTLSLPASVLADIFKLAITGTVVADDKIYDGTTAATGSVTLSGVLTGDQVTASAIMAFVDANAGSGNAVTISDPSLSGADGGNYTVTLPASTLADIFRAAITVTANSLGKDQGASDPALTYTLTSGQLYGSDSLAGALARAPGELPGDYAILQGTLAASSNYELTFVPGVLTIEPQIVFNDDLRSLLDWQDSFGSVDDGRLLITDERDCETESADKGQCGADIKGD